jgi:lipopolysaccharide biosynthesis glycosyltransferase
VAQALVFAADEMFARGLAVSVASTLANLSPACRADLYVLDNGLSERSRDRVAEIVAARGRHRDLRWVTIPAGRLTDIPMAARLPAATYSRLLLTELLAPGTERVVYLDADLVVMRDVSALFGMDLGGAAIGAARDFAVREVDHRRLNHPEPEAPRPYYNYGVLVIDVARWLESALGERALAYASRTGVLFFADQDALNAVVDQWHALDDSWNVQVGSIGLAKRRLLTDRHGYLADRRAYRRAAVIHFLGPRIKPWDPRCETLGAAKWALAFARSGWYPLPRGWLWLAWWWTARIASWPAIASRRWRARLSAVGRPFTSSH